jgi:hypothetical protein
LGPEAWVELESEYYCSSVRLPVGRFELARPVCAGARPASGRPGGGSSDSLGRVGCRRGPGRHGGGHGALEVRSARSPPTNDDSEPEVMSRASAGDSECRVRTEPECRPVLPSTVRSLCYVQSARCRSRVLEGLALLAAGDCDSSPRVPVRAGSGSLEKPGSLASRLRRDDPRASAILLP